MEDEELEQGEQENGGGASRRSLSSAKDAARGMQNPRDAKKIQDAVSKHRGQDQSKANAAGRKSAEEGQNGEGQGDDLKQQAKEQAKEVLVPMAEKAASTYGPVAGKAAGKLTEKIIDESKTVDKALDKVEDKLKEFKDKQKKIRIYRIASTILPIIIPYVVPLFVVILIYSQIGAILDQIQKGLENAAIGIEKYSNLISGNGWNTDEELFFKNLISLQQDFGEDYVDIPLIAATVHYEKAVNPETFDGEEGENNDKVDKEGYDDTSSSFFSGVIDIAQTHAFYQVANDKLGMSGYQIGGNGLVSNLVYEDIYFERRDVTFAETLVLWLEFFDKIKDYRTKSYDEIKKLNDDSNFKAVVDILYRNSPLRIIGDIINYYDTRISYAALNQSKNDWDTKNLLFDVVEQWARFSGNYDDEDLENNPASYYSTLEGTGTVTTDASDRLCSSLFECIGKVFDGATEEEINGSRADEKQTDGYLIPVFKLRMDYKKYYRYLVRVYIPATYFYKLEEGVDYTSDDVIRMANEIFDQKEMFDYLADANDETLSSSWTFEDGSVTLENYDASVLENIQVSIMPADGSSSPEAVVSLEDYTLGVLAKNYMTGFEDENGDEYLKAMIVAIKSATMNKYSSNYHTDIKMSNSKSDFLYCNIETSCSISVEKITHLRELYVEVQDYYLYNTETNMYSATIRDYKSACSRENLLGNCIPAQTSKSLIGEQVKWKNILASNVAEPVGLLTVSKGTVGYPLEIEFSSGLQLGTDGFLMRTAQPTQNDIYWSPPWQGTGNIGQCVWYAKGRALEIVANSLAPEEKKNEALQYIKGSYGNGGDWFTNGMCNKFACSADYTKPRTGSMAVYRWTDSYWKKSGYSTNYGHVIIVERVEGNRVWITEGWNTGGGAGGASSWSNVYVRNIEKDISYMAHLSGYVNFVGYVYLLD